MAIGDLTDKGTHDLPSENAAVKHHHGVKVTQSVTINRPRPELYQYWRNLENLPTFMQHLDSVTASDINHSHWVAKAPLGKTVEWDAEIINEVENELIAWKSLEGADIPNAGSVRFYDATGGRGTVVKAELNYDPPAGLVGSAVAKLFGEEPQKQMYDDMHHFQQIMETGEVATTDGQSSGRDKDSKEKSQ